MKRILNPFRPKPFAKPSAKEPASSEGTGRSSLRCFPGRLIPLPQRPSTGPRLARPTFFLFGTRVTRIIESLPARVQNRGSKRKGQATTSLALTTAYLGGTEGARGPENYVCRVAPLLFSRV